jgi:Putative 2OG-Fe(II) oxygenase
VWLRQVRTMASEKPDGTAIVTQIDQQLKLLSGRLPDAAQTSVCVALCQQAMKAGRAAAALPLLRMLHDLDADDISISQLLGFALRQEQCFVEAEAVFTRASKIAPDEPGLLLGLAQTRYELGLPAAALFETVQQAMPDNFDIVRNRAMAMAAEGDAAGAEKLLTDTLATRPGWLDGHKALATLRWTGGDNEHFADSYKAACIAQPRNTDLWLAWFRAIAQTRDWTAARKILADAEQQVGATPAIIISKLFVATESGDDGEADALLAQTAQLQGDTINLCRIRHFIRQHRLKEAESIAISLLLTPSATMYWPYLSLIWRLTDDARQLWLDRPDIFIREQAIDMTHAELAELADVLRSLHTLQKPYIEQSVRGGTQTDRSVMLRHEPILQKTRARWMDVIRAYISDLPKFEQGHPLLGVPRTHLLIEGSWSVRLLRQGYNAPHTHALGWLSSVLYVALPKPALMGPAPAGQIAFGLPPAELGTTLSAYHHIKPQVGCIATFPSTTWHGTVPFEDGERLVIALDIRTPGY